MNIKLLIFTISLTFLSFLTGCSNSSSEISTTLTDQVSTASSSSETEIVEENFSQVNSIIGFWEYINTDFGIRLHVDETGFLMIYSDSVDKNYINSGTWEFLYQDGQSLWYTLTSSKDNSSVMVKFQSDSMILSIDGYELTPSDVDGDNFFSNPLLFLPELTTVASVAYIYDFSDYAFLYASAIVKNEGEKPIIFDEISCDILSESGEYIAHMDSYQFALACPQVIAPGEQAYIAGSSMESYENLGSLSNSIKAEFHYNVEPSNENSTKLILENPSIVIKSMEFWNLSGRIYNSTDQTIDNAVAAIGLFDSNSNFLGAMIAENIGPIESNNKKGISSSNNEVNLPAIFNKDNITHMDSIAFTQLP